MFERDAITHPHTHKLTLGVTSTNSLDARALYKVVDGPGFSLRIAHDKTFKLATCAFFV